MIFSFHQPGDGPFLSPQETALLSLAIFLLFTLTCATVFHRLGQSRVSESSLSLKYHRAQSRLAALALLTLAFYVYALDIRYYLDAIPGVKKSLTLSGGLGLLIYLLHLGVVWFLSHPFYQKIHHSVMSRRAFIAGHLSFSAAILIPWCLLSLLSDLTQFLPLPAFFKSATGEWILLGLTMCVFIFLAPWLLVRLWRCRPIPEGPQREELDRFCRENRFKVGGLLLWPLFGGEMLTAGIMGVLPRLRYILITRSLLALLNIDELKAVMAHEMGHARRHHVVFFLIFFVGLIALTSAYSDVYFYAVFGQNTLREWAYSAGAFYPSLFSMIAVLPVMLLAAMYFRYVFGFFLRNSERQADLCALQTIGHPHTLISAFQKIAFFSGKIENLPSWHHFSIRQRIDFLEKACEDEKTAARHNRRLYGCTILFVVVMGILIAASGRVEATKTVQGWRAEYGIGVLEKILENKPDDPSLLDMYGGLLMERGRFEKAESSLRIAHDLAPDDAGIMNNLAWLYATAPPPFFNPEAALKLARLAAARTPTSHVLDTLAEACYANGLYDEALEAIARAIAEKPKNLDYFLRQQEKFENAAKVRR